MLLFLGFGLNGFGQTYTLNLHVYVTKGVASVNSNVGGNVYTFTNPNNYGSQDYPNLTTIQGNSFTFSLSTNSGACSQNLSVTKSLLELLRDNFALQSCPTGSGYYGNFYPNGLIPNGIIIKNRNSTTEVCSGEQLELDANSPNIFPNEVYHWQYSLDNKTYWYDVPASKNNSASTKFSINDFLGSNIHNYFDKIIYFRLGYGQNKQFTTPLGITFKPCAPIITKIIYEKPQCQGDPITKLNIVFDRKLDDTKGEILSLISVKNTINNPTPINTTPLMQVIDQTYPESSKTYVYSNFANLSKLENSHNYNIEYQVQINDPNDASKKINKGTLISPSILDFKHIEPTQINFVIKKADNPKCNNDQVEIVIDASGGTGNYTFYIDDIEQKAPKLSKEIDNYYHIKGIIPIATNSIKVTDTNGCIDKTITP
jgi:hypothetical protein